jgi:hypothetical protein
MESAVEAVAPPALTSEQPAVHSQVATLAPALFLGPAVLLELAWLSGIGYFVYSLLS